jgi:alpha-glucosidase (family GH31 glycosyl hydrolase)
LKHLLFGLIAVLIVARGGIAAETNHLIVVGNARFTVIAPECIRIEYADDGKFVDAKTLFAVGRDAAYHDFKLGRDGDAMTIDTGKIRLRYRSNGKLFDKDNLHAQIAVGKDWVEWLPGQKNRQNLGGTIRTLDQVKGPVDLGEGVLARDGWFLLDDSKTPLFTENWVEERPENANTDWYLFGYGHDYKAALKAMTRIGGAVPLPRKYVLGAWYSRYWPYTSKEYREIIDEYRQHDFPLDVIVMDMDWHKDGWTGWSWNRKLLPDAEELLQWFHLQGLHVTLNVHPADGVGPHEDMYGTFMRDMGEDPSTKKVLPYDAGNKKYLDTLFKDTHEPLEREGVDFWWLDWQQFPFTHSLPHLTNLAWLNHYYYMHTGRNGMRGQSFSRWAGWGDHRHPIHFSGDADTGWKMLTFEVPFTSTAGNVGCFFWSHDIGGHMGDRNEESYTRWVQFGATTAALRSHSTRNAEMDRRPWKYSRQAEDSMRIAFHLRSELFPYIYSSVWESCTQSLPLNRPMYVEYPDKEEAYANPQEYLFGENLLVAPITSPGEGTNKVAQQAVWFPDGTWYNWFTDKKHTGERDEIVSADINEFPLYAKGGVPIPLQPYTPRMTTEPLRELIVRCYPGEDGKPGRFTLYEDDGLTKDYLRGKYATTELTYQRNGKLSTVTINPAKGTFAGQLTSRSYVVELPCTAKAENATIDGKPVETEYDENAAVTRVRIASRSITQAVTVAVTAKNKDTLRPTPPGICFVQRNAAPYPWGEAERGLIYATGVPSVRVKVEDRAGTETRQVFAQDFDTGSGQAIQLPELPPLTKSPDRGLAVKRILYASGGSFAITNLLQQAESYLTHWSVAGPFDFDPDKDFAAQKFGPELSVLPRWQKVETDGDHAVDLRKLFDFDNKIAYAITYLESEKPQTVKFKINTDDGMILWLNGKKLAMHAGGRPLDHPPDFAEGLLRAGRNTVLLKVSQYNRGWGFKIGVDCENPIRESEF